MVEKYLPKCIESAINQSYENIEVILSVSEGTDRCVEICREYKKKDDRIVVVQKERKGRGPGRNFGIEAATGDFIIFIDGDDYMEPSMIAEMVKAIEKYDADVSVCADYYEYENDEGRVEERIADLPELFDKEEFYKEILKRNTFGLEVWNKLYKFEKIKGLYFPNIIAEDRFWSVDAFERVEKIAYVPSPQFHYVIRNDSGSRKPHVMEYSMKADILLCNNIKRHGYLDIESDCFLFLSCYGALYEALHFGYFNYMEWIDCYKELRRCSKAVRLCKGSRRQDKIKAFISNIGFHPMIWFMRMSIRISPAGIYDDSGSEL